MGTDPIATTNEDNIIVAKQIFKTYNMGNVEVAALRGVDLAVERGEMIAIMGPSGSGKTTLLNCLSGLDDFDQGDVLIDGTSLRSMSDRKRTTYRAKSMGFVFQTYNLLPVLSAVENVELPLLVSGTRPGEARQQALHALEQVGLGDRSTHRPAELSGGQRQRVTIARALVNNPAIIWADEPTGNLDTKTAEDILDIMRRLNQENKQTFVIVTHDPVVAEHCDRIISVSDGQIVEDRLIEQNARKTPDMDESIFQPKMEMADSVQLAGESA
ncbi:ABC transporter ATP-binding protein [Chloroflexi bacterium TSY]|nr:ABC transporter ATP-binding protein [Chloroflexi bacterium TSY]